MILELVVGLLWGYALAVFVCNLGYQVALPGSAQEEEIKGSGEGRGQGHRKSALGLPLAQLRTQLSSRPSS